ncbi:hypothetical protein [uncultured Oscillibacter sp.]|jgi:hypothetical protein|uniref:hypothetical protein n=1 Tax=uncultured Oscillibacter sp. TaxID=876091 RepID=UPI00262BEAF8|nr:hypothetical protein [uncultured Oscillibacter sp.]
MDYKILIEDDELDIVSMLASFFAGKGYQSLTARIEDSDKVLCAVIRSSDWLEALTGSPLRNYRKGLGAQRHA